MDATILFRLTYGMYVLTAKDGEKDNGCIINTAGQVTDTPLRMTITLGKMNYTHDMIVRSGQFNISVLDETAPFSVFRHFGFQSGKTVEKFENFNYKRSENGITYIPDHTSAFLSGKVIDTMDFGTHTMFLADVTDAGRLSEANPVTYGYYQSHIKPKSEQNPGKHGYRCRVCGFIYEGDELPPDYICPICKHGAADFERI